MPTKYQFIEINTRKKQEVERLFSKAHNDIRELVYDFELLNTIQKLNTRQLSDRSGYYEDFINRLEEIEDLYRDIPEAIQTNNDYRMASGYAQLIHYEIEQELRKRKNKNDEKIN